MPQRPQKPCNHPGCRQVTRERYCPAHAIAAMERAKARKVEPERESAARRGYDRDWRTFRAGYLAEYPFCVTCKAKGVITPASVLHHIQPLDVAPARRLDPTNLQALCRRCHEETEGRARR